MPEENERIKELQDKIRKAIIAASQKEEVKKAISKDGGKNIADILRYLMKNDSFKP